MTAAGPVRVAVVGMNYWGPNLARNVARLPGAELTWCCDLDEALLDRHRPAFPATRFTTSLDDVLTDPGVDAVMVATSVPTHARLALQAIEAGKHCFV
ncbi:MAG: Gfo/Idh/MocA family oxidoreductase, partial [Actinomycetota bacterium]